MKVKQDKYNQHKPPATPAPEPVVEKATNVINSIDIEQLTEAIRATGKTDSLENVIFALKDAQVKNNMQHAELVKYLSDKMDVLVQALKDKPTSFEFDVKRNNNGFITTVLVKPVK